MSQSPHLAAERPAKAIYVVYESMVAFLRGEVDILDALLKDDIPTNFYNFLHSLKHCRSLLQPRGRLFL